jgi:hypothetical protein
MRELKIDGVIHIPDDMTLQWFCEKFNEMMDKGEFSFSGGIKEIGK